MIKNLTNKKKKGFTLVELVVVIAIIAILAAVLVPQVAGYIRESRKTEVISEARDITTAVESINARTGAPMDLDATTWVLLSTNTAVTSLLDPDSVDRIPDATTLRELNRVLASERWTFTVDDDNNLDLDTIDLIPGATAGPNE